MDEDPAALKLGKRRLLGRPPAENRAGSRQESAPWNGVDYQSGPVGGERSRGDACRAKLNV